MPLITTSYPNLSGGVSQQPASQRLLTQCEEQENALPLIVGGLIKRPPTEHVKELQTTGDASIDMSNYFTHLVQRDSSERFFVSIDDDGDVFVHDIDGTARNVYQESGSKTYLNSTASPKTAIRAVTIADVTFLLNTEKSVGLSSATSSGGSNGRSAGEEEALVWIKSSGHGVECAVEIEVNPNDDPDAGLITTKISFEHSPEAEQVDANREVPALEIFNNHGTALTVTVADDKITFGKSGQTDITKDFNETDSSGLIHDTVFNLAGACGSDTTLTGSDWEVEVVYQDGAGSVASPSLVNGSYPISAGESLKINAALLSTQYQYPPDFPSTTDIAASLANGTTPPTDSTVTAGGIHGINGMTSSSKGSVIWVKSEADAGNFQITAEDAYGQTGIKVIKDEVQSFSDLPSIAPNGMVLLIKGNPESEIDDYYVKFIANGGETSTGLDEGVWVETVKPGIKYTWDFTTLPHILIRQDTDKFVVKSANGLAPAGIAGYSDDGNVTWSNFKFGDRSAGSEVTNPEPSFVDHPITDIAYFKNRLAFLSGENCALSEAGELFNFWRITVTQLLDTAPVDVGVGGTEINKLERAVPFSNRLILFSERSQFALQGEGILSPKTASIFQVTNFDVTTGTSPVSSGNTLFFPFARGSFSGVREFYKTGETDINYDAVESTSAAPKYIKGTVQRMAVSTLEDILVIKSADEAATLYLYKFFKTERGRIQSAWFKFKFDNCEIIDVHFVLNHLYMIIKRGSKTYLERMNLQSGRVDTGKNYTTHLDRRVQVTAASDGYVLNFPAGFVKESGDVFQVVSEDGEIMTVDSITSSSVTLEEAISTGDKFWIGAPYTMRYEMTPPILKRPKDGGGYESLTSGRHQLRYMTVVYDQTAYFNVRITPQIGGSDGISVDYPFSGRFLSTGGILGNVPEETGDFRFPVFAQSDAVKIEILNDSPLPSNIQSVEFEAQYTSRSQRM